MDINFFSEFVRQNGFAAGCLAVLAIAVWRTSVWLGKEIVKPLFDRLMRFIDVAERVLCQQAADMAAIRTDLQRVQLKQEEHFEICSQAASAHS
ncbi:MAG: hypothetical protein HY290_33475 [Planctomycetia bacterium]|nr:hypothetical protein [Planctomycetia bacterium]